MRKVSVEVGGRTYRCEVAEDPEDRRKGLSDRKTLPPDEGMLFDFSESDDVPEMWMKDTVIPLDMIGIDNDDTVVQVSSPKPGSEELVPFPGCVMVLEVNAGSGIAPGDDVETEDDGGLEKYTMKVLAPDGSAQALLQGGERIFSRKSTRMLVSRAKKAFASKDDKEQYERHCRKLGKYVFKELKAQDSRDPQYVALPGQGEDEGKNSVKSEK